MGATARQPHPATHATCVTLAPRQESNESILALATRVATQASRARRGRYDTLVFDATSDTNARGHVLHHAVTAQTYPGQPNAL